MPVRPGLDGPPTLADHGISDDEESAKRRQLEPSDSAASAQQDGRPPKRVRREHACELCGTSYGERRTLLRHYKTPAHCQQAHLSVPSYRCVHCAKGFTRADLRLRHVKEVHRNVKRARPHGRSRNFQSLSQNPATDDEVEITTSSKPLIALHLLPDPIVTNHGRKMLERPFSMPTPASGIRTPCCSGQTDAETFQSTGEILSDASCMEASRASPTSSVGTLGRDLFGAWDTPPAMLTVHANESPPSLSKRHSLSAMISQPLRLARRRVSLIRDGASPRQRTKQRLACVLCRKPFGETEDEVRSHLRKHAEELSDEHMCYICKVGFGHRADLEWHQGCADNGHCGYQFEHSQGPCTGHHMPCWRPGELSDHDRVRLCISLRHWEQLQLQTYMHSVEDALEAVISNAEVSWSMGVECKRSAASLVSLSSRLSHLTIQSTPGNVDYHSRANTDRVRVEISKRFPSALNAGRSGVPGLTPSDSGGREHLDTLLTYAAGDGRLQEAEELLRAVACANGRRAVCAATPLTMAATRGHLELTSLLLGSGGEFSRALFYPEGEAFRTFVFLARHIHKDDYKLDCGWYCFQSPSECCESNLSRLKKSGHDLKQCSYAVQFRARQWVDDLEMKPVRNEREGCQPHEKESALVIGHGNSTQDYSIIPLEVSRGYSVEELPAEFVICRAIQRGNTDLALLLLQHHPLGRSALPLHMAAVREDTAFLQGLLRSCKAAAGVLKEDHTILQTATLNLHSNALDVLLPHSSAHTINAVLCKAIADNNKDAVALLCSKTSCFVDPLQRQYDPRLPTANTSVDADAIRQMVNTGNINGTYMDYRCVYAFLAVAVPAQRFEVVGVLAGAGVPEALILRALGNIGTSGHHDGSRRSSGGGASPIDTHKENEVPIGHDNIVDDSDDVDDIQLPPSACVDTLRHRLIVKGLPFA